MQEHESRTEAVILDAAKKVFLQKGYEGARMQQIADEAGINKALLHYYFRNKDKLFDAIFDEAFRSFFPDVSAMMMSDLPFEEKIHRFVNQYIDLLLKNPYLPSFILHELQRKPERFIGLIRKSGMDPKKISLMLKSEAESGKLKPITFPHLFANLIGMCVFPFVGRPILENFVFNGNSKAYEAFLKERKAAVAGFVIDSLKNQ